MILSCRVSTNLLHSFGDCVSISIMKLRKPILDSCPVDVLHWFINQSWWFISAYCTGLTGRAAKMMVRTRRQYRGVSEKAMNGCNWEYISLNLAENFWLTILSLPTEILWIVVENFVQVVSSYKNFVNRFWNFCKKKIEPNSMTKLISWCNWPKNTRFGCILIVWIWSWSQIFKIYIQD